MPCLLYICDVGFWTLVQKLTFIPPQFHHAMIYFYFQSLQTFLVPVHWRHSGSLLTESANADANFTHAAFTNSNTKCFKALWQSHRKASCQIINNTITRAIVRRLPPITTPCSSISLISWFGNVFKREMQRIQHDLFLESLLLFWRIATCFF